jgi:hypothetical protein
MAPAARATIVLLKQSRLRRAPGLQPSSKRTLLQAPPITSWRACHDRIFINEYDSHRIVSTLGLEAEEETAHRYALRPLAAARSRFRATLGNSELIWERGAASPRGRQLS